MSKLKTTIPVDISSVLDAIKAMQKATVTEVTLAENAVVVEWDCDNIVTPYTFATDYPLEKVLVNDKVSVDNQPKKRRNQ